MRSGFRERAQNMHNSTTAGPCVTKARLLAGLQLPKMRAGRNMSLTEYLYRCRLAEL